MLIKLCLTRVKSLLVLSRSTVLSEAEIFDVDLT